jgi:hypothetical protein
MTIICYAEDEYGNIRPSSELPIPAPVIEGPFLGSDPWLQMSDAFQHDNVQLQKFLSRFGYYKDEIDGLFGPVTHAALNMFQSFAGVTVDGIAGPETKAAIMMKRMDAHRDANVEAAIAATPTFRLGTPIPYWVGTAPGYLRPQFVGAEVTQALTVWEIAVAGLSFTRVATKAEAKLVIRWDDLTDGNPFKFDGPGGSLAETAVGEGDNKGSATIRLDAAEHWNLQSVTQPRHGSYYLLPVLIHELGHAFGLSHAPDASATMAPYYVESRIGLAPTDIEAVNALFANP